MGRETARERQRQRDTERRKRKRHDTHTHRARCKLREAKNRSEEGRRWNSLGRHGGWPRQGVLRGGRRGQGQRVLEASPAGRFPHLWVAAAVLRISRNQLRGSFLLAPTALPWDLVPGGCLPRGPSQSRAGKV